MSNTPETEVKQKKLVHAKPSLYAYYFEALKAIAKDYGYNLVVHGSMNRDLDLIAIPWVNEPKPEMDMINALSEYINGFKSDDKGIFLHGVLPGGRNAYVLNVNRGGYMNTGTGLHEDPNFLADPQYYIDISVTPFPK
jgi:hypothetical protein